MLKPAHQGQKLYTLRVLHGSVVNCVTLNLEAQDSRHFGSYGFQSKSILEQDTSEC